MEHVSTASEPPDPTQLQKPQPQPPLSSTPRRIPVDIDHAGIRLAVPGLAVVSVLALFVVFSTLLAATDPAGSLNCVAFLLAVGSGLGITFVGERVLKRVWPSRRAILYTEDSLRVVDERRGRNTEIRFAWDQRINVLAWRFTVRRGSARIPRNWIMLGCQLVQDDHSAILYTFAPPAEADEARYQYFEQLVLRTVVNKGELPLRESNRQRRLLRAEDDRWQDGAELRRQDYAALVDIINRNNPNWQSQT